MSRSADVRSLYVEGENINKIVSYYGQVSEGGKYFHILPQHAILLLDCQEDGSLVNLADSSQFNKVGKKRKPWLLMQLKLFRVEV